jgi:hypothetical protein
VLLFVARSDAPGIVFPGLVSRQAGATEPRRGEVLLKPSRIDPTVEPVPPELLGLFTGSVPRSFTVEYHFQVFQPTYDPIELANGTYQTFGHQTAPSSTGNLYFYQIASDGSQGVGTPAHWLYPETDFSVLFKSF